MMPRFLQMVIIIALLGCSTGVPGQEVNSERATLQEDFLKLRFGLFLHFNMATYVNREWATGYEDPAIFKPDKLNCNQWADVACAAGMGYGVLTVKHTGGW
ncbi:MAG: alpha-L-fucosidase, partial [Planctomycetota bacterium]